MTLMTGAGVVELQLELVERDTLPMPPDLLLVVLSQGMYRVKQSSWG